jgi:hypothetical protein
MASLTLESLHFGGSVNFMETPVSGLEGNGKMTESQLKIAVAFVTEVHGVLLVNVCPRTTIPVEMH